MNAGVPIMTDNWNHFDRIGAPYRVLGFGDPVRQRGLNWDFVNANVDSVGENGRSNVDCLWIEIGNSGVIALDLLQRSGVPVIINFSSDDASATNEDTAKLIDAADAYILPDDSDELVAAVVGGAIGAAIGPAGFRVAELSDGTARTMQALSAEAGRIAEQLSALAAQQAAMPTPVRSIDAMFVRRIIKLRRDRERFFPAEIFADPAWDMLLDLAAARLEDKRVPVSSLCIAAAVPTTTALRWIRSLTEAGLLLRRIDESDARRSHVELSDTAVAAMLGYLQMFSDQFSMR